LPRHARARPRRTWRRDTSAERIALALHEPDALRWGWLAPGIRRHRLSAQGASLLRVAPNREAPRHDHDGIELTLVLRGELVDESGVHQRGDLVLAGPGHSHSPRAGAHGDCICLISMDGSWRLSDWKQRLAARLFAS
jgi:putative transcriptional regulator